MSVSEAIKDIRREYGLSQREVAERLHIDRAAISRAESGKEKLSEHHDSALASLNWKMALTIIDERSGGYISNILDEIPNLDLHPSALKELLLKEIDEAETALEGLIMAKHMDPEKRKEAAEKVWHEIRDVIEKGLVMSGVLVEEFGLDRKRLIQKHEHQVKRGER